MEELKCFLLGFGSYPLARQQVASSASPSPSPKRGRREREKEGGDVVASAWLSPTLRERLHPAEVHLVTELLPLGEQYTELAAAAQDTAVGRTEGIYPSAVGVAVSQILQLYAADVKRAATPSALAALRATYGMLFQALVRIVRLVRRGAQGEEDAAGASEMMPDPQRPRQQQQRQQPGESNAPRTNTAAVLAAIQSVVDNKEIASSFRQIIGVCVWRAVLYTTAHYVAHGVVLHGRRDYFISVSPAADGRTSEQHTLHTDMLPAGLHVDLGMLVLTAGKERRVLLSEADTHGGDHLEQLAMGTKDVAADAVFKAIFNLSLCEGGVLAADELTARVEAARALWSKALWTKVGSASSLVENLEALRAVFLCTRGDVWLAFVERCFDALSGLDSSGDSLVSRHGVMHPMGRDSASHRAAAASMTGSAGARKGVFSWAAAQRSVTEAFTYALSVSGLAEGPVYDHFRLRLAAPESAEDEEEMYGPRASRSVEATAQLLLDRARSVGVRFATPPGLQLVVSQKALSYYQRLFSLHVGMRFTTYAMNLTRQLFSGAIMTNKSPSPDLRRAYALFQLLSFLLTTVNHYFQVDVVALPSSELEQHIRQCRSVEEAKRRHDRFIWRVAEGSFLTEGSEALHAACRALCECTVTLYVLCTRYRLNYWAVEGLNRTPVEVAASLAALETRVQQRVTAAFTGHLSTSARQAERALWARIDFNRFFSYRPTSGGGGGPYASPDAGLSSTASGARWRSAKVGEDAGGDTRGGFAQPRVASSLLAPKGMASHANLQSPPPPPPPQQQQRARSVRGSRRSSSTGAGATSRRTRHTNPSNEIENEEGEEGRLPSQEASHDGGRTVISSAANRYRKTDKE